MKVFAIIGVIFPVAVLSSVRVSFLMNQGSITVTRCTWSIPPSNGLFSVLFMFLYLRMFVRQPQIPK